MNDLSHHLYAQACNNAWSNLRLLRACGALDDAEFAAPRTGFVPSLKDTLNHIVTVDWLYVDALERAVAGRTVNSDAARFFEPPAPFATCAALAPAQREVDQRLIALCAGLSDLSPTVLIQRADHVQREPLVRVLAHLFQHQIHHRDSERNLVRGGPSLASLAHALADVVRHAPRRTLHLTAKLGLTMWKAGDDRTNLPVELKCASIDVEQLPGPCRWSFRYGRRKHPQCASGQSTG